MDKQIEKKDQANTNAKSHAKKDYIHAVGRRREAIARVRLYEHLKNDFSWDNVVLAKGELYVNKKPIADYFPSKVISSYFNRRLLL